MPTGVSGRRIGAGRHSCRRGCPDAASAQVGIHADGDVRTPHRRRSAFNADGDVRTPHRRRSAFMPTGLSGRRIDVGRHSCRQGMSERRIGVGRHSCRQGCADAASAQVGIHADRGVRTPHRRRSAFMPTGMSGRRIDAGRHSCRQGCADGASAQVGIHADRDVRTPHRRRSAFMPTGLSGRRIDVGRHSCRRGCAVCERRWCKVAPGFTVLRARVRDPLRAGR
jgi:hypothetical protein